MFNLFKKGSAVLVATLLFVGVANAGGPQKFSCPNVGGVEEWTIYVDLGKKLAGYFDGDATVVVPLISYGVTRSFPAVTTYTFEGKDTVVGGKLRINFRKEPLESTVIVGIGTSKQRTLKALQGCAVDDDVVLEIIKDQPER